MTLLIGALTIGFILSLLAVGAVLLVLRAEPHAKPDAATRVFLKANVNDPNTAASDIGGQWTSTAAPYFYAELGGVYEIALFVQGADEACNPEAVFDTVTVTALPNKDIYLQLVWGRSGNDHDLHLVNFNMPGAHHSRGDQNNSTDCHWQNCNTHNGTSVPPNAPDWGQIGVSLDNPALVIDDISGPGPEISGLSSPEIGDYLVSVENYSGDNLNTVWVRIWIFGELRMTAAYGPQAPEPAASGFRSNCFWRVAWVRVNTPEDIEVVSIGDFGSSDGMACP